MRGRLRRVLLSLVVADHPPRGEPTAQAPEPTATVFVVEGVIHRVDARFRWLELLVGGVYADFYVPSECPVVLNGQRVKLRLLQAQDRARLTYCSEHGLLVTQSVTVDYVSSQEPEARTQDAEQLSCATVPH